MTLTKNQKVFITLGAACAVLFFVALARIPGATDTEYLLDSAGCDAAKRLGAAVAIKDGVCFVRVIADHGAYLRLESGGRVSKDHVLGYRVVK